MKTRAEKLKLIEEIKSFKQNSTKLVFISLLNLKAEIQRIIKEELKKINGLFKVYKKTLLKLSEVFNNLNIDFEKEEFKQPFGVVFDFNDSSDLKVIQLLHKYYENEQLNLISGIIENQLVSKEVILSLAKIPSKEFLILKFMQTIKNPLLNLSSILKTPLVRLNLVVSNIKNKNE